MRLKIRKLDVSAGAKLVAVLNRKDAWAFDIHHMERIMIRAGKNALVAIVDKTEHLVNEGEIGLFDESYTQLFGDTQVHRHAYVHVTPAPKPLSIDYIKDKLEGKRLTYREFRVICEDIIADRLTDVEETYFVSACVSHELTTAEIVDLTKALVDTGARFRISRRPIMDKHCIGGVAGNRTTLIAIPIVAEFGLTIPKTSTRSITSPAGTIDTIEALCSADLSMSQMMRVVKNTNGCLVSGEKLNLVPANPKIIGVEKPMGADVLGLMLAGVLGKKKSVSATHVLIDIPWGKGSKVPTKESALKLKNSFEKLGKMLDMKVRCVLSDGTQPVGNGIGPALEAMDVTAVLSNEPAAPKDLRQKSLWIAAELIALSGKMSLEDAMKEAEEILRSGRALKKFEQIAEMQGRRQLLSLGKYMFTWRAPKNGKVSRLGNREVVRIARRAGAPDAAGAGVYLFKKRGDLVRKGEAVIQIFSANKEKLEYAKEELKSNNPYRIT